MSIKEQVLKEIKKKHHFVYSKDVVNDMIDLTEKLKTEQILKEIEKLQEKNDTLPNKSD